MLLTKGRQLSHYLPHLILLLTILYASLFFLDKQDFINADLGRHLASGKLVWTHPELLTQNFFSYTHPDHPFANHHWLSGAIFYQIYQWFDFAGLSIFAFFIYTATFILALFSHPHKSIHHLTLALIVALPLITIRNQVRPEMFSYFGITLYIFLLQKYQSTQAKKYLYLLPIYQLFWVNAHIYYVYGLGIIGLYWLTDFLNRQTKTAATLFNVGGLSLLACLASPHGYEIFFHPFVILRDYGYTVTENQSIFVFLSVFFYANYYHLIALITALGYLLYQKYSRFYLKQNIVGLVLLSLSAYLGATMLRNVSLFGYIFLAFAQPLFGWLLSAKTIVRWTGLAVVAVVVFSILAPPEYYRLDQAHFGVGLKAGSLKTADFIKTAQLKGPIFNNYNIGGYLIYQLSPEEKVFVDNRPEAYPPDFFQNEYIPMQQNEQTWLQLEQKYRFQTIIYDYTDVGVWKEGFLNRRLADPSWEMVYKDNYGVVIFSKKPVQH